MKIELDLDGPEWTCESDSVFGLVHQLGIALREEGLIGEDEDITIINSDQQYIIDKSGV